MHNNSPIGKYKIEKISIQVISRFYYNEEEISSVQGIMCELVYINNRTFTLYVGASLKADIIKIIDVHKKTSNW